MLNPWCQNSRWLNLVNWIELAWVRVRMEWEWFWVNLREDNKSESKMTGYYSRWQNSRWLPSSSLVTMNEWSFFVQIVGTNLGKCEWFWLWWLHPRWQIQDGCHHPVESEWLSEVLFVQNGWIEDGRIQDGCYHQVESEWMSLSHIELVLCKMAETKMSEFKMVARLN